MITESDLRSWCCVILAGCACVLAGCGRGNDTPEDGPTAADPAQDWPPITQRALTARGESSPPGEKLFVPRDAKDLGIDQVIKSDPTHRYAYFLEHSGMEASGVAAGDIDGDGLPDVFLASSPGNNRLYRQVSPLKFEDITPGSGLDKDRAWSRGAAMADIDNDGDLDIYVANYAEPNHLYINQGVTGNGRVKFEERAGAAGLALDDASLMPVFCDYDADGDLDVYVLSNLYHLPDKSAKHTSAQIVAMENGLPVIKPPYDKFYRITAYRKAPGGDGYHVKWDRCGRPNYLFRNNGDGTFSDVTAAAGMEPGHGRSLSATWWDYNDDGHLDLYVANDWGDRDFLYHNNGDGTFRDAIEDAVPCTSMFSMGADSGDLNNDGLIDFIGADMSGTTHYKRKISMGAMEAETTAFMASARPPQNMRNAVYLNTGTGRVMEAAYMMGLANSDWSWAVKIADLDNDGRNDVFITNGMEQNMREIEGTSDGTSAQELRKEKNVAFRNAGNLKFEDSAAAWGLDYFGYSIAAASCDFDRDGDLDLFVINRDEPPTLYENTSRSGGILVALRGRSSNRAGIGATVRAETASGTQVRQIMPARGYLASDEAVAHFGLGSDEAVAALSVEWPSGHQQKFENLATGQFYTITEPGSPPPIPVKTPPAPLFASDDGLADVSHHETDFDDFAAQPLLPNKLSQLGPGIAVGDLDGDGDEDFVLGGAAGSQTQVVISSGGGKYEKPRTIGGTERFEDMGVLLFDADSDGDRDLFVVSGGVESDGAALRDRLYLNDGTGQFTAAPADTLPPQRGQRRTGRRRRHRPRRRPRSVRRRTHDPGAIPAPGKEPPADQRRWQVYQRDVPRRTRARHRRVLCGHRWGWLARSAGRARVGTGRLSPQPVRHIQRPHRGSRPGGAERLVERRRDRRSGPRWRHRFRRDKFRLQHEVPRLEQKTRTALLRQIWHGHDAPGRGGVRGRRPVAGAWQELFDPRNPAPRGKIHDLPRLRARQRGRDLHAVRTR